VEIDEPARVVRIPQDGDTGCGRNDLLENLQSFRREFPGQERHAGDVPSGACQAHDEASLYGIAGRHHDDGDRGGCTPGGIDRRVSGCHDHVNLELDELNGPSINRAWLSLTEALNALIDKEVGEDIGQMLPGGVDGGWVATSAVNDV